MINAVGKIKRLVRFALVGGANTAAYFVLANISTYLLGIPHNISAYLAYALVLPFSFFGHRRFTFRSSGSAVAEWYRFCIMQGICLAVIAVVNAASMRYPASPSWVSFSVISFLIPAINFLMMQVWVFAMRKAR
ncbi:GtrA family protein [Agrobacterium pusense]|uniref:GtrA family protein n=1 Tax=Agrobacterium pusense TaxID=648995 RepID=UPI0035E44773